MSDNEKAIIAINGAARERGMSYGQFVNRATTDELREAIVFRFRAAATKKKKRKE